MKYARIVNNTAVDVRTDSPDGCFTPNIVKEFVTVPDEVENGWINTDGTWAAPPPVELPEPVPPPVVNIVPQSVSARQAEKALILAELDDDVDALLAAMPGVNGKLARAERNRAQTVERNNPLVLQMATELGLSSEEVDQLFILAATL